MANISKILIIIFFVFAIVYVCTLSLHPYTGSFAVKAIPVLSLSVLALLKIAGIRGKLLFAALIFSAAGDITLALGEGQYFVIGLGFFLIAQVVYLVTFSRDFKAQRSSLFIIVPLVAYSVAIAVILTPYLGGMALPVYVYITAITLMGIFAASRDSTSKLVLYGALFFIASDSILAINEFMISIPASAYLVMVTYYAAQFLILYGYLRESKEHFPNIKAGA